MSITVCKPLIPTRLPADSVLYILHTSESNSMSAALWSVCSCVCSYEASSCLLAAAVTTDYRLRPPPLAATTACGRYRLRPLPPAAA